MSDTDRLSFRLQTLVESLTIDRVVLLPVALSLVARSVWVTAAVGVAAAALIYRIHSQRLVVRPDCLLVRTTFRTHRIALSDVRSLEPWLQLRSGTVLHLPRPPLSGTALEEFEMFVHRHAPDIEIRSSGASRWERQLADPATTLRTLRTAQSGRWRLTVKPVPGGYRAAAQTFFGPQASHVGELRSTLAEATDDATEMIEVLRDE